MDITNDRHRRSYMHNVALLHKELFRFGAYCLDHGLGEQLFLRQPRYALVQVYGGCVQSAVGAGTFALKRGVHGRPGMVVSILLAQRAAA